MRKVKIIVALCLAGSMANAQTSLSGNAGASNSCTSAAANDGGVNNTSVGCGAGKAGMTGTGNTSVGNNAGNNLTSGYSNTTVGAAAGSSCKDGFNNSALGINALGSNISGTDNSAFGFGALDKNIVSQNSGFGSGALYFSNTGSNNNAFGFKTLYSLSSGSFNVAMGDQAGYYNQTGANNAIFGYQAGGYGAGATNSFSDNCFFGSQAGYSMKSQSNNIGIGYQALYTQNYGTTFSSNNIAIGYQALYTNNPTSTSNGQWNNALGYGAGYSNTTGQRNNFFGTGAGYYNSIGNYNYYLGTYAGYYNTTGSYNVSIGDASGIGASGVTTYSACTFIGQEAGHETQNGNNNSFVGFSSGYSNTTGVNNTAIGYESAYSITTGSLNTCVGYLADVGAAGAINRTSIGSNAVNNQGDNTMWLGDVNTKVWTTFAYNVSDGRFKTNVQENVHGLDFINKLRPVTYNMNMEALDNFKIKDMSDSAKALHRAGMDYTASRNVVHAGFIAQEVETAAQQTGFTSSIISIPTDLNKSNYGLNYTEIVVPLVKAVQELSHKLDSVTALLGPNKSSSNGTIQQNTNTNDTTIAKLSTINVQLNNVNAVVLNQNVPNPFAEQTVIAYIIPKTANTAQMLFYDDKGSLVNTVNITTKGQGQLNVYANDLTSGTYSYTLVIDGAIVATKKMLKQ